MTTTDQYLAGLFDGEGSVSMSLAKQGYLSVCVKVAMCDRAPVAALHERFGGQFSDGKQKTKTGRNVYTWAVYSGDSVEALTVFSELCLVKCVVAKAAIPVAEAMRDNPSRGVLSSTEKLARLEAARFISSINKPVGKRRILDENSVAAYMQPKTMGGGKAVKLSDGRKFASTSAAARALNVDVSAVRYAKRTSGLVKGLKVEEL